MNPGEIIDSPGKTIFLSIAPLMLRSPAPAAKAAPEHGEFKAIDLARESAGVVDRLGSHHFWGCAATQLGRQPQNFR